MRRAFVCSVKRRDALFVQGRGARETARTLRVNEHLPSGGEDKFCRAGNLLKSLPAPPSINGDLLRNDEIEAEQRNVGELALENDGEVRRVFEQRKGFEKGLVLGRNQDRARGNVLDSPIFEPKTAIAFQKPD